MNDTQLEELMESGITRDTLIIEIKGGVLTAVHNDSNGYVLFDWDAISENDDVERQQANLAKLLEVI